MDRRQLQQLIDDLKTKESLDFFFDDNRPQDAVEYFDVRVETELDAGQEGRLLSNHMTHISVNPQDDYITKLLLDSYVLADRAARGNIAGVQVLNSEQKNVEAFVAELIKIAKAERERSLHPEEPLRSMRSLGSDKCMIVLGERGSGKTFFLNYLLSKWNAEFTSQQVVWVRLNLVTHTGFEGDIRAWMFAQTAKILLRFYDVSSDYVKYKRSRKQDFYAALFEWADRHSEFSDDERKEKRSRIRRMKDAFSRLGGEARINPALCDYEICSNLFRIAREKGWSFIMVLDGFDNLDVDKFSYDRFVKIKGQISSLWSDYENSGYCLIISSRTYTFAEITSSDPFKRITPEHKFLITAAPIEKIMEQRFSAVKELLTRTVSGGRRVFSQRNWTSLVQDFAAELVKRQDVFNELNAAYQDNNRAKIQLIQLMFQEYLQRRTGQGYRLLEHAMKAGLTYPPVIYRYQQTGDEVAINVNTETFYDARYIPVLTRPPLPREANNSIAYKYINSSRIMQGVRLLQVLVCVTRRFLDKGDVDFLLVQEVVELLHDLFGYDPKITEIYIRELEAFELVRVIRADNQPPESTMFQCYSMPKAEYALRYYLSDVAFLNLVAMRTHFADRVFAAGCVELARIEEDTLQRWIRKKIQNSLTMFMLIHTINKKQERLSVERISAGKLQGRLRHIADMAIASGIFKISDSMEEAIKSECANIYANLLRDRKLAEMTELDDEINVHKDNLLRASPRAPAAKVRAVS